MLFTEDKGIPTFEEWLDKYWNEPKVLTMYKPKKGDDKMYTERQVKARYKRAYFSRPKTD